ncbi:ATP-dependent zinc metalloprotease yme1l, partial [Bulinus truncatus]
MASVFTQSFYHTQAAVAMSHLSSLLGSVRTMSSHKDVGTKQEVPKTRISINDTNKDKNMGLLQVSDMVKVLSGVNVSLAEPFTTLVKKNENRGRTSRWSECHVSADSFFENKTGFPQSQLSSVESQATHLHLNTQDPLFRKIFKSLTQSAIQCRGFKTLRSDKKTIGVGSRKETQESFLDNMQDLFSSRSDKSITNGKSVSDVDPELDKRLKIAFAEGYRAKEDGGSKKKWPSLRGIFFLAVTIWILYKLLSANISIKTGGSLGFLNSISYEVNAEDVNVTFEDVKGAAEAKQELQDIVNFLRDPEKYTALGAKLPKGVLLVGPPGVGKTLLARAVAGEAGVPFFHASGSEFDEMFVGLGAKRIRQLFSAAQEQAPCIIFIDEFDSVGAKRTSSAIHPYANQTVNQLLNEMDGFQQNEGIIVMGATNKVDNMDKALRRPGRFDVEVTVTLPDFKGRKEIIELYISKVKKDPNVDVDKLARGTTGFSGAELENLVNQAALKAVIDGNDTVTMDHLEFARDKIIMGPERKHRIPDEETNLTTAYHEAGHTLVAYFTKDATPLHKVTIIPRGQSLGH